MAAGKQEAPSEEAAVASCGPAKTALLALLLEPLRLHATRQPHGVCDGHTLSPRRGHL